MGSKRDSRKQKKREKNKAKSQARKRSRSARVKREQRLREVTLDDALSWPVGDAFLSENWHEQGPQVQAVFTRQHTGGAVAAAVFDVDLREQGVRHVETLLGLEESELHMELARRSQDKGLMVVDPGLVVKVVSEGSEWGASKGHTQPSSLDQARALFGDTKPSIQQVLVGSEPPPEPPKEGFFASLKKRFG